MINIKLKKADLLIGVIVLVVAGIIFLINGYRNTSEDQLTVEVRVDGELVDSFLLEENIEKEYHTEFGYNKLVIQGGVVSVTDADCSDNICVDTKDGRGKGDAIVCVPNRFTVEIVGSDGGEIDAIAQ